MRSTRWACVAAVWLAAGVAIGQVVVSVGTPATMPAGTPATGPDRTVIVREQPGVIFDGRSGGVIFDGRSGYEESRDARYLREALEADRSSQGRPFVLRTEMVKGPYLGVSAVPVEPALGKQLSLPEGVGLVADYVDPAGPGKPAGVEMYDVLWKFNDQILINPPQLAVLVRMAGVGTEVKLTVIRQAKPQVIPVTLVEKEVPKFQYGLSPNLRTEPAYAPLRIISTRSVLGSGERTAEPRGPVPGGVPAQPGPGVMPPGSPIAPPGGVMPPARSPTPRSARDVPEGLRPGIAVGGRRLPAAGGMAASISLADGTHTLTVTYRDGSKSLLAKDREGNVLFDGPINTPAERQAVPQDVLKKLEQLEKAAVIGPEAPDPRSGGG